MNPIILIILIKLAFIGFAMMFKAFVDIINYHNGFKSKGVFWDRDAIHKNIPGTKYPWSANHVFSSLMQVLFICGGFYGLTWWIFWAAVIVGGIWDVLVFNHFWNKKYK